MIWPLCGYSWVNKMILGLALRVVADFGGTCIYTQNLKVVC